MRLAALFGKLAPIMLWRPAASGPLDTASRGACVNPHSLNLYFMIIITETASRSSRIRSDNHKYASEWFSDTATEIC